MGARSPKAQKLVIQALPWCYFDAVRAEEIGLGCKSFGTGLMGPEVSAAELEAFIRASLMSNTQCLKKVAPFCKSFDVHVCE